MYQSIKPKFQPLSDLKAALVVELCKVIHSRVLWITALVMVLITLVGGLFMFILKDPETARSLGVVGAKAELFGGKADWPSYFNLMTLLISLGGLVVFGFIFTWLFGREFVERTVNDLLALPTSRTMIVTAKIITGALWSLGLILVACLVFGMVGAGLKLPLWSVGGAADGFSVIGLTAVLTVLICITFALIASLTRGYLPAVGALFLVLLAGQVLHQLGYAQYFPWSIPMLYSGAAEALAGGIFEPLGPVSYILVGLTGLISSLSTIAWWRRADQT